MISPCSFPYYPEVYLKSQHNNVKFVDNMFSLTTVVIFKYVNTYLKDIKWYTKFEFEGENIFSNTQCLPTFSPAQTPEERTHFLAVFIPWMEKLVSANACQY